MRCPAYVSLAGLLLLGYGTWASCTTCDWSGASAEGGAPPSTGGDANAIRSTSTDTNDDSTKDAGYDSGRPYLTGPPAPKLTSKPPMPSGAIQSCGVYDGPLCQKECSRGNCRQDCDGVSCELSCPGGWCSQLCGEQGKCKMTCSGGHCAQACTKQEGCTKDCTGGDCS